MDVYDSLWSAELDSFDYIPKSGMAECLRCLSYFWAIKTRQKQLKERRCYFAS